MSEFRFYAELNDFLPRSRRGRGFEHAVSRHQSLKHVVESFGVPHTEVGLTLVNGEAAPMDCRLGPNDRVSVLPSFRTLRTLRTLHPLHEARTPRPGEPPRFIADAHLGRLARYLRFAGFDTLWHNAWSDAELVAMAARDNRIVLTRDRALLMHKALDAGCYVRDQQATAQLADVARRYALDLCSDGSGRCLECNALPQCVAKAEVVAELLPATRAAFNEFWRCPVCLRVYWRGSHWRRMRATISDLSAPA